MKRLFVLRHAKSSWDQAGLRDFDRPLNERGRKAAVAIGAHMHDRGLEFDLVLASPAERVRQTIAGVEEGYGRPLDPDFRKAIYAASAGELLEQLRSAGEDSKRLLLIGHNPGFHELVLLLAKPGSGGGVGDDIEAKFPTAALAELEVRGKWSDLRPGSCKLRDFVRPRDLEI